jgi:hypothetical protein
MAGARAVTGSSQSRHRKTLDQERREILGIRPRTSAMTAGLTDHAWSLREVLQLQMLPWPQSPMP